MYEYTLGNKQTAFQYKNHISMLKDAYIYTYYAHIQ